LCYTYIAASEADRRSIENQVCDDDIIWFVHKFIDCRAEEIRRPSDVEPLLLGLAATAMIGPHCAPMDIGLWGFELYKAAFHAGVSERRRLCEQVASLATSEGKVADTIKEFTDKEENYLQELAARPARPDAKEIDRAGLLRAGFTPLMLAALDGNLATLSDLVREGIDINTTLKGASALAFAAFAGKEEAVNMLLDAGATIDVRPHGMSLLEFARMGGAAPPVTERLMRAGAK
jgi:hypothetical protein